MIDATSLEWAAVAALVLMAMIFAATFMWSASSGAKRITRLLQREKVGATVRVHLRFATGTWDPSEVDRPNNRSWSGPGVATYSLNKDGMVQADFVDRRTGIEIHRSGPIPASPSLSMHPYVKRLNIGYVALVILGFVLGFVLAHGHPIAHLAGAAGGVFVAMVLGAIGVRVLLASLTSRASVSEGNVQRQLRDFVASSDENLGEPPEGEEDVWQRVERNERIARRYLDKHHQLPQQDHE